MSGSREQILASARDALAAVGPSPEVPRDYIGAGESAIDPQAAVELFAERVGEYGGIVRRTSARGADAAVEAALRAHQAVRVCAAPDLGLEVAGVDWVVDDPPLSVDALGVLDGVVTGCTLAIAQTGTIVLAGEARCGRRAISLIPDLHVCLVEADRVAASLPDAIMALAERELHTTAVTFISGPSATVDIGFERVDGVHGPRRLEVVLIAEDQR